MKMFLLLILGMLLSAALWYAGFAWLALITLIGTLYLHAEPYLLTTTKYEHEIKGLKKLHRIIFIADLQIRFLKNKNFLSRIVKKISAADPDLIIVGGDLVSNETKDQKFSGLKGLEILSLKYPVCAVLGNHEYGRNFDLKKNNLIQEHQNRSEEVEEILEKMKIKVLRNSSTEAFKTETITLYGTDDLWAEKSSWNNLQNPSSPLIVIAHNPDTVLSYPENFNKPDLVLSGHTHGGQIRLPFLGALGSAETKLSKRLYQGKFIWQKFPFIITRGLGESGFAIRFLCPPEIVEITLKPK